MANHAPATYRLADDVTLREEAFGGIAYSYATRRLSLIGSKFAIRVARLLTAGLSVDDVLRALGLDLEKDAQELESVARRLVHAGILVAESDDATLGEPGVSRDPVPANGAPVASLVERYSLDRGLRSPICLTWELTYGCNLACIHCLSSSGKRDPKELSTSECERVIDELSAMGVFYVNVGGGEPTIRRDFWHLVDYASSRRVGIKFSTNGSRITDGAAQRLRSLPYVDIQISVDGADAETNDAIRGPGAFAMATTAMGRLAKAGVAGFKISVVVTRTNVGQLEALQRLADRYSASLRLTRLRPSGRGASVWDRLRLTATQQRTLYRWLLDHPETLTGDSFFHLSALGESLPGMNLCGAGRVVALIDPVGDVYACPFVAHERFLAGNVRQPDGFPGVWESAPLFTSLRQPSSKGACTACGQYDACRGGCMAAKFFIGLPIDGPDPECVLGHGVEALGTHSRPVPPTGHSRVLPVLQSATQV